MGQPICVMCHGHRKAGQLVVCGTDCGRLYKLWESLPHPKPLANVYYHERKTEARRSMAVW